jgi:hypothetical protein
MANGGCAVKKLRALISLIYDKLGDPRSKNVLLFILAAMTLFGMVAPDTATSVRDAVLGMTL